MKDFLIITCVIVKNSEAKLKVPQTTIPAVFEVRYVKKHLYFTLSTLLAL